MKNLIRKLKFNLKHLFNTKKLTKDDVLNKWLLYHNTSVKELINKHPKEVLADPKWFTLYPVTEEQYDKWEVWCKKKLRKYYTEREFKKSWGWIALDCSPIIKKELEIYIKSFSEKK